MLKDRLICPKWGHHPLHKCGIKNNHRQWFRILNWLVFHVPILVSYKNIFLVGNCWWTENYNFYFATALWPRSQIGGIVSQRLSPRGGLPAPNSNGSSSSTKKTRRRVASMAQRRAANIRERRRMFNLNEAFDKLRRKVSTNYGIANNWPFIKF